MDRDRWDCVVVLSETHLCPPLLTGGIVAKTDDRYVLSQEVYEQKTVDSHCAQCVKDFLLVYRFLFFFFRRLIPPC